MNSTLRISLTSIMVLGLGGSLACSASPENDTVQQIDLCLYSPQQGPDQEQTEMVKVELARDFASRARGLMQRTELDQRGGMLFYYLFSERRAFWMYQTLLPLDIAYLAADGEILQIETMEPCDSGDPAQCRSYPSEQPARAALELNAGAFADFGIAAGDYVYDQECQQAPWDNW